ncbi:hypothetical protein ACHAXS_013319 [Conticribra weissflogii]
MTKSYKSLTYNLSINASNINNTYCLLPMILCYTFLDIIILQNLISQCNFIHLNLMKSPKSSV